MFAQPYNHSFDDLFNQYVNVESSDGNKDYEELFPLDSLSSDGGDHSPTGSTIKRESPQPWTKDKTGPCRTARDLSSSLFKTLSTPLPFLTSA